MAKFRRVPLKSIEEFKWHTRIIKTFGKKALLIYTAFPRNGAAVDESEISKIAADSHSAEEIMKFMLDNGLIEPDEGGAAPAAKAKPEEPEQEPEPAKPPPKAPARPSWKEEEKPEEEAAPEEEAKPPKAEKAKPSWSEEKIEPEISPEEAPGEKEEEEIRPEGEEAPAKEEEIEPEKEEEIKPEIEEEAPAETHEIEAEAPKEEEIQPEEEHEAEAAPAEEEAKPEEEAAPEEEAIRSEQEEAPAEEESGTPNLTPAEMIVHDKYGEQGVLIFRLIDGKRSVADVAKESGATQDRVMEVLKYLDEVGLISLGGPGAGGAEAGGAAAAAPEEKFAPLEEEKEEITLTIDEQKEGIKLAKTKPGTQFISKMKTKMEIVFKFGKSGREILDYLDARKEADSVRLAIKLNIPINTVESVLSYLKTENIIELGFMQRDEIKKEFGYDAYIMYKRYGKKGVIFYEVIDKEMPLKKIAELISEKDPARIIEIFKLIRDVLGIDLPINEDAIKKDLVL